MSDILKTLQPLLIVTKYTLFFFKHHKEPSTVSYKIYLSLKLLFLVFYLHCCLKVLFIFFIWPSADLNITNNINFVVTSFYVITNIATTTTNNSTFNKLLGKTSKLDPQLKLPLKYNQKLRLWIYASFVIIFLELLAMTTENLVNYSEMKRVAINYPWEIIFHQYVTLTIENINVTVIVIIVKMIHFRFEYINAEINTLSNEINTEVTLTKLRCLRPLHKRVEELIEMFNEIFGISLLAMNTMFFTQFVLSLYILIVISTDRGFSGSLLFYLSIKCIYFIGYVAFMWIVCHVWDGAEKEVKTS